MGNEQYAVGGYFVATVEKDYLSAHYFAARNFANFTVSRHFHGIEVSRVLGFHEATYHIIFHTLHHPEIKKHGENQSHRSCASVSYKSYDE